MDEFESIASLSWAELLSEAVSLTPTMLARLEALVADVQIDRDADSIGDDVSL
jgi:hypothetical protein